MGDEFELRLENCRSISDVFGLVKEVAYHFLGMEQAGLLVGLSDLGKLPHGFVGAFYSPQSNMIIVNRRILERCDQELYTPYLFHVLLHEYIHSLGFYDEEKTRRLTLAISRELGHPLVEELAKDMGSFFPDIVHSASMEMPDEADIEFVHGIDRKNVDYIY